MNMQSILRKPNQTADRAAIKHESRQDEPSKSRFVTLLQGAIVFVVLFVTMYTALRWILSQEDEQTA
jgi:type VI protein secretion system component VasF